MSYDIIYARQFVKVETEENTQYLPFVLTGSSNVYDMNNRRSRSWWNWTYYTGYKPFATKEEILNKIDEELIERVNIRYNENDTEERIKAEWNWYVGLTNHVQRGNSFDDFKKFFINGFKNAVTIEQLVKAGEHITIKTGYVYYKHTDKILKGNKPFFKIVQTTKEFLDTIREAENYHKNLDVNFIVDISLGDDVKYARELRKKIFGERIRKSKERKPTKEFYVIEIKGYGGFVRKTKYGFKYSWVTENGKKFLNKKQAERKLRELKDKIDYDMKIKKITVNHEVYI